MTDSDAKGKRDGRLRLVTFLYLAGMISMIGWNAQRMGREISSMALFAASVACLTGIGVYLLGVRAPKVAVRTIILSVGIVVSVVLLFVDPIPRS